ncbi:phosphotransferase [Neobacillus dielmonensis]|uniref:phosphotransferase n=1 Tax=Neobacillus dielmonensis TaxID=1347369 RepID=UPI0006944F9E|nr:NTP transferase domain-containing protein [Neobacillus dielmonensis]
MSQINQAVILAAGERKMFDSPVGFLELEESTIIERIITILNANGIDKITITTGYKKEYYEELAKKRNLNLVYCDRYKWTGTMSSLALASEHIDGDFLLIESDMVFEERAISYLLKHPNKNCMLITSESGSGDEVLVEIRNNYIYRISKDIHQLNKIDGEFIGLSKISLEAYRDMLEDFKHNKNPYFYYEYSLLNLIHKHNIGYEKIDDLVWSEIDSVEHYHNLQYLIYPKLKRKEMEIKERHVKELLAEVLEIDQESVSNIEKLGGLTNDNFKVTINGQDYVARVPGTGTEKTIDRRNEKFNSTIAYQLGLDSRAIYFNEETGLKIAEFIKNAETLNPTTAKREDNMELIAGVLRRLHTSDKKFHDDFDPFDGTEYYQQALLTANGKLYADYFELKEKFMPLKGELNQLGLKIAPGHLDALPENFIKSGEDKLYLIDWEYSGNYDILYDVAAVSLECSYTEDEEELFFKKYFGTKPTEQERRKIEIHKIMQDMYWSMWSAAKVAMGDPYLADYSVDRYNRGKQNLFKYLNDPAASLSR